MTVKVLHKIREDIKAQIDCADQNVLEQVHLILKKNKQKDDVVAMTVKGKKITRKELEVKLIQAEEEIKEGNFITLNKFKKAIEKW